MSIQEQVLQTKLIHSSDERSFDVLGPKILVITEGSMRFLQYEDDASRRLTASADEIISIPGSVKHALRNRSQSTLLLTTTEHLPLLP